MFVRVSVRGITTRIYLIFFRNYAPGLHSAADNISLIFVEIFMLGAGIFVNFGERGVSAVQGHLRSIESAYATSY